MRPAVGLLAVAAVGAGLVAATVPGAATDPAPARVVTSATALAVPALLAPAVVGVPTRVRVATGRARVPVVLERAVGRSWRLLARATTERRGAATFSWLPTSAGRVSVRVRVVGGASPVSRVLTLTVAPRATGVVVPASATGVVRRVVAAAGQRMWLDCAGTGGPTVVLVAGIWGTHDDWGRQLPGWRAGGRVCVYDRPGVGLSPARSGSSAVHAGVHAGELRALLRAAGERGPFLLVGHSYGGMVARALLAQWPALVAGLVLQDSVPPGVQLRYDDYGRTRAEGGAVVDYDLSSQATAGLAPLAGLPLVVLAAGRPVTWAPDWVRAWWAAEQHRTALASSNALDLVATAAEHQLQVFAPTATSTSVTVLRRALRGRVALPVCGASWQRLGVTCRRS